MKTRILILIFIATLFACSKETSNYKEVKFEKKYQLKLDSIKVAPLLLNERRIVIDSNLLISLNIDSDTIFRVFDLTIGNYIGNFGNYGRGPFEFNLVNISGFHEYDGGCVVTDFQNIRIIQLPESDISNKSVVFEKQFLIPKKLTPLNNAYFLNDSMICGTNSANSPKELVYFNPGSNKTGSLVNYSELVPNAPESAKPLLYLKDINGSRSQQKLVFAYRRFPFIKICDFDGNILNEFIVDEGPNQKDFVFNNGSLQNTFSLFSYYNSVSTTSRFIYALFEPSKLEQNNNNEYTRVPLENKQMHIFNWDGKPVAKIILEDWMNVYTPASDDSYIYFIDPMKESYLFRYSLETVL